MGHSKVVRLTAAAAALAIISACSNSHPPAHQAGAPGSTAKAGRTADRSAANAPAAWPAQLPSPSSSDQIDQAMRTIIAMAAAYAKGAPDADRHPQIISTNDFICGSKVTADACLPTSPQEQVTIAINPEVAWTNFQQAIGEGGGPTPLQASVVGAYATYLTYRDLQRRNPALLHASDHDALVRFRSVVLCKTGEVIGGLREHRAMSDGLTRTYASYDAQFPDFVKGTQGQC